MPTVQSTAPRSNTRGDSLADILERVLDTGIVIAGDIRVQLADIELLTIQIRLIICSVDKAQQLGMDWWKGASFLTSDAVPAPAAAPAAQQAPAQFGQAEAPAATVSSMQQQFGAGEQPEHAAQGQAAWQAPPQAQAPPWAQPLDPPQPTRAAPTRARTDGEPAGAPGAQAGQQTGAQAGQQAGPQPDSMAVQTEMLNERLARLEAVLERLVPPEE